jgi:hypothetical protein
MKFIDPNVSFTGFHFLKTVYTQFHLDETSLFLFFYKFFACHQKILCDTSFIENKISTGSSLKGTNTFSLFNTYFSFTSLVFYVRTFSTSLRVRTALILEPSLKLSVGVNEKYKRLTIHNFLCILCLDCIYYDTDLRDSLLYGVDS